MPGFLPLLDRQNGPERISLPPRSIQNQGTINACFSCAIATALEARAATVPPLSPAFHFHYAAGGQAVNGLTDDQALSTLQRYGIASFKSHPCLITLQGIQAPVSEVAATDALARRLDPGSQKFQRGVVTIPSGPLFSASIKRLLDDGAAAVILFFTNDAYWQMDHLKYPGVARTSRLANRDSPFYEAHVACVIGWVGSNSCFVVQDSHGVDFGEAGQWLLPLDLADSGLISNAYGFYSGTV